tara:strand:+ start:532 stop:939 length:408 start_codon:yes stop_codon:yes gene_type:complete
MNLNNINENNDLIEQNLSLECPICYTTDNLGKKFGCEHLVCKDCFSNQLKTSMSVNLKCPICNSESLGKDIEDNELHKLFGMHFINCVNKGIPVKLKLSNGEYIDLPLEDLVPNRISEERANKLSDLFVNKLSKR